jgi:hypothetical protein
LKPRSSGTQDHQTHWTCDAHPAITLRDRRHRPTLVFFYSGQEFYQSIEKEASSGDAMNQRCRHGPFDRETRIAGNASILAIPAHNA